MNGSSCLNFFFKSLFIDSRALTSLVGNLFRRKDKLLISARQTLDITVVFYFLYAFFGLG